VGCMSSSGQGWRSAQQSNPHRPGLPGCQCSTSTHAALGTRRVKRAIDIVAPQSCYADRAGAVGGGDLHPPGRQRGPVLYRHAVIGRYGVQDRSLKLRTYGANRRPDARSHRGDEPERLRPSGLANRVPTRHHPTSTAQPRATRRALASGCRRIRVVARRRPPLSSSPRCDRASGAFGTIVRSLSTSVCTPYLPITACR